MLGYCVAVQKQRVEPSKTPYVIRYLLSPVYRRFVALCCLLLLPPQRIQFILAALGYRFALQKPRVGPTETLSPVCRRFAAICCYLLLAVPPCCIDFI